jgi:5-methyltetrahydropteroyltriglutamate--homocysteine methyltransferase
MSLSHVRVTVDNGGIFYGGRHMALAHNLGFLHTGAEPEIKQAVDAYCRGKLDQGALREAARELRTARWQLQKDAGIELLPVGDFAWRDRVLTHSLTFGVIPECLTATTDACELPTLDTLVASEVDCELAAWFDTGSQYLVPEFTEDQRFRLSWEQLFEEVDEAHRLGHKVKPVLIGPLTYLWLGKARDNSFDRLDLLERLLPVYGEILGRLAAVGVEWVQLDEPILALDLAQDWKTALERAYHSLQYSPLKKLLATYFGGLKDNLGLVACLPVAGLHIDAVAAPEQLAGVLDRLPTYKVLSLGVVDGCEVAHGSVEAALAALRQAQLRFGDDLWVAGSGPLLAQVGQPGSDSADRLALAVQKCGEISVLAEALNRPQMPELYLEGWAAQGQSQVEAQIVCH